MYWCIRKGTTKCVLRVSNVSFISGYISLFLGQKLDTQSDAVLANTCRSINIILIKNIIAIYL